MNHPVRGFQLIELIVYLSIVTIVLVVFSSFAVDVTRNAAKAKITQEVQQNARLAIARLNQDIRGAESVSVIGGNELDVTIQTVPTLVVHRYFVQDDALQVDDGTNITPLTSDKVRVATFDVALVDGTVVIQDLTVTQATVGVTPDHASQVTLATTAIPRASIYNP